MAADPDESRLVDLLQRLVRAAGVSAEKALAVARAEVEAAGATATSAEPGALFASRAASGRRPLVLSGHVDVVPAGEGWKVPPFDGHVEDGRVWGRGTSDMLGAVACFLHLVRERPDLPLAVALTTDEETGMQGAVGLVAAGVLDVAAGVVVGEPTDFEVGVAEKGVLWARLVARGRGAHGSTPERGENAAEKVLRAWSRVAALPLEGEDALLGRPTRSLNLLRAGTAVNVVPDRAEAEVDFRFLPDTTGEALLDAVRKTAAPDADVEAMSIHPPFAAREASPLADAAEAAVRAVRGDARRVGLPYGTEASRYAALADCVILGPGERAVIHTGHESIRVGDLVDGYRAYAALADRFFARGGGGR